MIPCYVEFEKDCQALQVHVSSRIVQNLILTIVLIVKVYLEKWQCLLKAISNK